MKTDEYYSFQYRCPTTKQYVSDFSVHNSNGVCHLCGHVGNYVTHAHDHKVAGRWVRYSWFERVFKRKQNYFISKEDEDKLWNTLSKKD